MMALYQTPPDEKDQHEAVGHFLSLKAQEATAGGVNRERIRAIQEAWQVHAQELKAAGVCAEEIERARIGTPWSWWTT